MTAPESPKTDDQLGWFDRASSKKLLWRLLWGICILTVVAELVYHFGVEHRHPHFSFDGFPGFYAVFGFLSCAGAIGVAKLLGKWLKTREDYYDD